MIRSSNIPVTGFFYNLCTERLQMTTKRSRLIGTILFLLCAALIITVIVMAIFWPKVKDYMLKEVCVDKDCMEAASQVRNRGILYLKWLVD